MMVIPIDSELFRVLKGLARSHRIVMIAGLPGVGKSLLIQQLALIAAEVGRTVHLLQWMGARQAFETARNLARYPENDGVTNPAIRKAVGLWSRDAVQRWHEEHTGPEHLLIGELPLIGNRLIELAEVHADPAESLLSGDQVQFLVPVPSWEVRTVIEAARARSIADPQHEQEKQDAAPHVLRALWQEVNGLARQIGLTKAHPETPYNPYIYGGVYQALLQHRHTRLLLCDQVLKPARSVYEMDVVAGELRASSAEVEAIMADVESRHTPAELEQTVAGWHAIITDHPRTPDPGPALHLPLPANVAGVAGRTALSSQQMEALRAIAGLPLTANTEETLAVLDQALDSLAMETRSPAITADLRKFDVYDSYFNVVRSGDTSGVDFLSALLQAYRNVLWNLETCPHSLTVIEVPLLRIALETTLHLFIGQPETRRAD